MTTSWLATAQPGILISLIPLALGNSHQGLTSVLSPAALNGGSYTQMQSSQVCEASTKFFCGSYSRCNLAVSAFSLFWGDGLCLYRLLFSNINCCFKSHDTPSLFLETYCQPADFCLGKADAESMSWSISFLLLVQIARRLAHLSLFYEKHNLHGSFT